MRKDNLLVEGIVEESLPSLTFRVHPVKRGYPEASPLKEEQGLSDGAKPKNAESEILAHLGGKLKLHHIKVIPGDRVLIELSPYDQKRGRIVRRL